MSIPLDGLLRNLGAPQPCALDHASGSLILAHAESQDLFPWSPLNAESGCHTLALLRIDLLETQLGDWENLQFVQQTRGDSTIQVAHQDINCALAVGFIARCRLTAVYVECVV